jgi:hypothetical protein
MTNTLTQVHRAHEAAKAAVDALFQQLKATYPKDSQWKVYLRDCQTRPTVATVLYWHWGLDPVVVFSIPRKREVPDGALMRRHVPVTKIVGPA